MQPKFLVKAESTREGVLVMCGPGPSAHLAKAFSETDTTEDLKKIDVLTLVLHGDDDQIVPIQSAALKSVNLLQNGTLKVYPGAPHGLTGAFEQEFNHDLTDFTRQ